MPQFSQSRFAAWLQIIVSHRREESGLYAEIAGYLPLDDAERVLDIGTGTGLQLRAIHQLQPSIGLFGIDLSSAAIDAANRAIGDLEPDLKVGSIEKTTCPDDFFNIVTCNSSMSYWDNPLSCFNEIYRILKPGGVVKLFEPHQDIDLEGALDQIRENMADKSPLRRWGAVQLNKYTLERGSKFGLNLYTRNELLELSRTSSFGVNSSVDQVSLLDIPIFVCIHLWKPNP
ncbi:MAG: class I SAM-dependent methyltransferase [Anaerolineales bacterium]|nr:class I SAM-dependent methyltransferase [Anaerolineales bacterium]